MGVCCGTASNVVEARSSANPQTILAMMFAVAGTTTTTSAQPASHTWGMADSGSS